MGPRDTGEVRTGRIRPANRGTMRAFLTRLAAKETIVAVEAMTGWRFIAEECVRAGIDVRESGLLGGGAAS